MNTNPEEVKMVDIVINDRYGGFGLSDKAIMLYYDKKNIQYDKSKPINIDYYALNRKDPILVEVVKELGKEANSVFSHLYIKSLPVGTLYCIREYDGAEFIETKDSILWEIA